MDWKIDFDCLEASKKDSKINLHEENVLDVEEKIKSKGLKIFDLI